MTPDDRRRLIQLLGMLGSDHWGEVVNAAKLAQRHLGSIGLTWEEVIAERLGGEYSQAQVEAAFQTGHATGYGKGYAEGKADAGVNGRRPAMTDFQSWRSVAKEMLDCHDDLLTEWERGFFQSYVERRWSIPTEKQRAIFERVADKTGVSLPP